MRIAPRIIHRLLQLIAKRLLNEVFYAVRGRMHMI